MSPTKRRRRRRGPDGFEKPTLKYKPPESITNCISTFNTVKPNKPVSLPTNPFVDSHGPSTRTDSLKVFKPPSAVLPQATSAVIGVQRSLEKPRSVLKPPVIQLATKPSVSLKPLAPPPQLHLPRSVSPTKQMKTIRTTNIAQATDPTKEGSGAELLSLFLQQHGHHFISATDQELQRGVTVSPGKRSRGKDLKFLRGGLAERVHRHISCTKTDFALWKRQMERTIESGSRFSSDMQMRILKVLDITNTSERSRFTASPHSGLALCRLMRRHQLTSGDLTLGTYVVLFHFAPINGGKSPVSSIDHFEQGNDVMVWLPWHKVELAGVEGSARLLETFRALDTLTPPHCLLVLSRFFVLSTT